MTDEHEIVAATLQNLNARIKEAVEAEREACAKLCESGTGEPIQFKTLEILRRERTRIAAAIRARNK